MNIEYFQEFVELSQRLNYREAAARLSMSQSALSKHVKALEASYGVTLFNRDRQSVSLTPAGAMLAEYAQQIWDAYEKSHAAAASSNSERPIIMSGVVESPDEHQTVNEVMQYVKSRGISRHVRMRNAGTLAADKLIASLEEGTIDCFVSYELMGYDGVEGVKVERICDLQLDVIVSAEHALAAKDSLRFGDMAGASFIQLAGPQFTSTWHIIEKLLKDGGVPHTSRPVPVSSIYDYINLDLGASLLVMPRKRGVSDIGAMYPEIKLVPVNESHFKLGLDVAYLESGKDEALACLIEALCHCYREAFAMETNTVGDSGL